MNPSIRLRNANEADLPAIVEIYNSTIPDRMATATTVPVTVESRLAWFREHNALTRPLWVAEASPGGEIAAWLSLNTFLNGRPAYDATAEVSIYVAEKHRRAGTGCGLMREAIAHAPRCGITTLVAFIFGHNEPSIRLAEKFGFERWGFMPRVAVLDGVDRDLAIMGRRIAE